MGKNKNSGHYNIPSFLNSGIKIIFCTATLYFLIAKLSLFIFVTEINILPFFPAIGFAIAAVLFLGRRAILGVALGSFLFSISLYKIDFQNASTFEELVKPLSLCIVRPIIASLNAFLVSYLSLLWSKNKYPFDNEKNVLFFALASLTGTFISVSIGFIPLALTSVFPLEECFLIWSNMWRGNVMGIILFTPFLLSWIQDAKEFTGWSATKGAEVVALIIFTLFTTLYVFETRANNESILLFSLIWAACRFGMKVITLLSLILSIIAIYYTGHQKGAFASSGWNNDLFMLQLFLFAIVISTLFLKVVLQGREKEESKLKISQQALNLEKNLLQATIESPSGISISSLDTNLNYLSFNSAHKTYMKNEYGVEIKIGDNHIDLISNESRKEEIASIFHYVLKGNHFSAEEKDATGKYWNISKSPIKNNEGKIIGVTTIVTNITQLKLKEIQLEENNVSLNERVKELCCLFDVSKIISNKALSKAEKMEACVQSIPKALQFPEIANCRILFMDKKFTSPNYRESDRFLKQTIIVNGEEWGFIEVNYFDEVKLEKENLFLDEEVKLLEALADIISKSLETKLAEEKLLKSEENYRTIFENVQDVFFKTSIETGEILDISPSCSSFNGITREELIGQDRSIIYSDKDKMNLMFQKIVTEQKVTDYINEIKINGKLYHVSINAKIILDANGEPKYAVGSIRDITERRLAEEKLKTSEEKFRAIYESFDDIYFKKNIDGTLLDVSPSIEKHFNISSESIIGQNAYDFYVDRAEGERFYEAVLQNQQVNDYEERFVTGTGEIIYFSVNAKVIYDSNGEPAYFEGTMRNVNERILNQKKLLEVTEKIKESEEKFRSIFENMQDVYYLHDIEGKLINISPSVEKHFQAKREDVIGMSAKDFYYEPAKYDELKTKLLTEGTINDLEVQFLTATGETLYFSVNSKLINDSNGNPTLVEGSMRNINDRIINQNKLLEATEKIKESEEKFRSIYENMEDVYFLHELDGTMIDISPSAEKVFQIKKEEFIGTKAQIFHNSPARHEELQVKLQNYGSIHDEEVEFLTATGEKIYFSASAKLIMDPIRKRTLVEGTMRNISERIVNQNKLLEANEKIKQSEEKFRSIYENSVDIYFRKDLKGIILEISPSVEKQLQYKQEFIIGKNIKDFYYDPATGDRFYEIILKEQQIYDYEELFVTASGESVYFSVNAKLVYDSNGNPIYVEGTKRNINERIVNQNKLLQATEKIKESEKEFRAIFNSFEDMYYRISLDGIIQNVSPSVEKILKFKREDIIDTKIADLYFNPQDRYKIIQTIKEKGYINDCETIFRDKDNNPIYISINAHLVYDSLGNPICSEGTIRDISERKKNALEIEKANQVIKESEQKYRTIFNSVRDVFFRASAKDHKIIDISPSCSYFDMKPEDIIGKSIVEFYQNPEDRIPVLNELMSKGEIKNYDVKFLLNSKKFTVSINSKIAFDQNGEPEFLIGSFRDVSDRVQAEENLKISEAKFRSIFENFEDVYFRTTMSGAILDVSPSFEKHFLKPCSYAIENSVFDFYHDQQDRISLMEKLKKEGQVKDFDIRFRDGEDNIVFFSVNARLIYDENGEPIYIEKSMRNINDRVAFQKEILAKNRTLEFQNTELEQFAYIASHDLQEPLITVIQCIKLLQDELGENLDEDQKQYLNFINGSTSRMQLLVKGLLDYSRIGKERTTQRIDCNEIIANVIADMDGSIKESNAIIEYENLPVIEGNTTEMRQLFQNIISNATKFRKKELRPKIKISSVREENNWLFSVEDNGIGIEEENIDKVFVIFKRLNNRNEYQGTGIGLSHCKKIIEHHGGKIWVESKFNEGSIFKWTFPMGKN